MAWRTRTSALTLIPALLLGVACDPEVEGPDDMEDPVFWDDEDDEAAADPDEPGDEDPDDSAGSAGEPPSSNPPAPKPEVTPLCEDSEWGGSICTTDDGQEGIQYCVVVDGQQVDTPCAVEAPECDPGWNEDYGCMGYICYWDVEAEAFRAYEWMEDDCNTPLVLNFDDAPVQYMPASAASFDISRDGSCMSSDWPTAPWLALDRDGDGFIRDGGELFGSATAMSAGGYAPHGFAALAELDTNRDGKISAEDERFGELVLWNDLDDDRVGAYAELRPLHETTLVSIDLNYGRRASCDGQGNCGVERASFEYRDAKGGVAVGEVVDVHLACR